MKPSAIRNLSSHTTPILVSIPQFSSHEELLLSRVVPEFFATQQANFNISKIIKINNNESNITIEEVRALIQKLAFASLNGELQAVVLPHIELASIPAQNALLKILEEPPPQIQFFLSTTAPELVLGTIVSRCRVQVLKFDIENNDIDILTSNESGGVWQKINQNSVRENIALAETYQSKQEAINIATNILQVVHQKLKKTVVEAANQAEDSLRADSTEERLYLLAAAKILITTIGLLQQNVNIKLALSECFIKIQTK
jgi:DNA polymerase III delta prime subunit